jgi:hypothetical protein
MASIIDHYNHVRLHSALSFLRPVDYYRGDSEALLAERCRKPRMAREPRTRPVRPHPRAGGTPGRRRRGE